jgi:hypothetical protein
MDSVLWPMEPVEPRIANFFTSFIFSEWVRLPGVPPGVGYFRSKLFCFNGMQGVMVAKIFYLNGLRLKYSIQRV